MVLSAGALLERPHLAELAKANGGQIIVPTGALLGLDAVADQLDNANDEEARERIGYVDQVIADFDRELADLLTSVRETKDRALTS